MNKRVLICGSRDWTMQDYIFKTVALLEEGTTIVHGAARGADDIADTAAKWMGYPVEAHPADWEGLGKRAGFVRNMEMLKSGIDQVYAFRKGEVSKGTDHTINEARKLGIPVEVIQDDS